MNGNDIISGGGAVRGIRYPEKTIHDTTLGPLSFLVFNVRLIFQSMTIESDEDKIMRTRLVVLKY